MTCPRDPQLVSGRARDSACQVQLQSPGDVSLKPSQMWHEMSDALTLPQPQGASQTLISLAPAPPTSLVGSSITETAPAEDHQETRLCRFLPAQGRPTPSHRLASHCPFLARGGTCTMESYSPCASGETEAERKGAARNQSHSGHPWGTLSFLFTQ